MKEGLKLVLLFDRAGQKKKKKIKKTPKNIFTLFSFSFGQHFI